MASKEYCTDIREQAERVQQAHEKLSGICAPEGSSIAVRGAYYDANRFVYGLHRMLQASVQHLDREKSDGQ